MKEVQWKKVGDAYLLLSGSEELVRLQYHAAAASELEIKSVKYRVERKGFWSQRFEVINNGYEVARSTTNFWGTKGQILFEDGTCYLSDFKYRNVLTLRFMEGDAEILHYDVGGEAGKPFAILTLGVALVDGEKLLLMAALGMVMFQSVFNEFNEGDDGVIMMVSASG